MRPPKYRENNHQDLFRHRLDNIIDMKHEIVILSKFIDWQRLDEHFGQYFSENGCPGISSRMMLGLQLLKQIQGLSDESAITIKIAAHYDENGRPLRSKLSTFATELIP